MPEHYLYSSARDYLSDGRGLVEVVVLSVLPIGILQMAASVEHGMWYARSADFLQQPIMQTFHWLRAIGDIIFASGTIDLAIFVIGQKTGWSIDKKPIKEPTNTEPPVKNAKHVVRKRVIDPVLN